ncbi:uncharacterized protein [Haliotis cracherodii]|uniref:uncharacterized protein n=1 Tax=Haliotis cracherodii TaxID=6455 RepID=UPI0039E9DF4E
MSEEEGYPVQCYVYDISKGMARSLSQAFIGKQIDGVWHTGIVVYGQEYFFGGTGGIESCPPGGTVLGRPDSIVDLGMTQIPRDMFMDYLSELAASSFSASKYHLLEHNCNNFSAEVAQFLTGRNVPAYITNLPAEVLSTPFGAMIKPLIDSMSVQPDGGHPLFPTEPLTQNAAAGAMNTLGTGTATRTRQRSGNKDSPSASKSDQLEMTDPVMYKPTNVVERCRGEEIRRLLQSRLSEQEFQVWEEMLEYLAVKQSQCSWSLGRNHLQVLAKVLCNREVSETLRVKICEMLQLLVVQPDFLQVISHDSAHMMGYILSQFNDQTRQVQTHIVHMLANMQTVENGIATMEKVRVPNTDGVCVLKKSQHICITCLTDHHDKDLLEAASALALNISLNEVEDDTEVTVEVASAVLQSLNQDMSENGALYALSSLVRFMQINPEVKDLVVVMSPDWSALSKLSERAKQLCDKIKKAIS